MCPTVIALLLSILATDILPIAVVAGTGYALARFVRTDFRTLTHVVFYATMPALAFTMLVEAPVLSRDVGPMMAVAVLVAAAMAALGWTIGRVLGLGRVETRAVMLVVMFSNAGNYGLPVVRFAYGDTALAYGTIYFLTGSVLTYTVGAVVAAGARLDVAAAVRQIARIPAIYGVIAALIVRQSGLTLPLGLARATGLLADTALPLMILVLGAQLHRAAWPAHPRVVALAVVASLVAAPIIALGCAHLLGVSGEARQAAVTLSAMPVAVATTIVAVEFDVAPEFVTSAVFATTVLSPLTLPLLIAYLK